MIRIALLLLAVGPQTPAIEAGSDLTWRALPLPSLCFEPYAQTHLPALEHGRHLIQDGDDLAQRPTPTAPGLPVPTLFGLLQDEASRLGAVVEFQPTAPPLLVRGAAADLDALEALVADLDAVGRTMEIEVNAWLTDGATVATTHPDLDTLRAAVGEAQPWGTCKLRSGAGAMLGTRESRNFVHEYSIELATDSGVAEPELGSAMLGTTLHLVASRTSGGKRVHVEGFLDASELVEIDAFDTDTYDLGVIQQPRVGSLQVAFSGTVESGGVLALSFAGAPLASPDRTLWLQLSCRPDAAAGRGSSGWRGLDLALLDRSVVDLPIPEPGGGLTGIELADTARALSEALPASALAQILGRAAGRTADSRPVWSTGLLLAREEASGWTEVDALVAAAQSRRERGAALTLQSGALRVLLPVADGQPARVMAGVETTLLSEYDAEVAQEVWLPHAVIEPLFDGVLLQGTLRGTSFRATAWSAESRDGSILSRDESGVGRLQLSHRAFQAKSLNLRAGAGAATVLAAPAFVTASLTNLSEPR